MPASETKGFMACHPSSSIDTPTTANPCPLCWRSNSTNQGISIRQGSHQVAQKFSNTTLPRKSESCTILPSASLSEKLGAGLRDASAFRCVAPALSGEEHAGSISAAASAPAYSFLR